MQTPFLSLSRRASSRGVALIIVLAFVVLLTGLIVAFFSRSLSERQISNSSANQTRAEFFVQGAAATIIGDLKQEIVAGSTSVAVTTSPANGQNFIFRPTVPVTAVPAFSGYTPAFNATTKAQTDGLNNVVKISKAGSPFYPSTFPPNSSSNYSETGPNRAAASPTNVASLNGRYITQARWNKPLLMQAKNTTDLTPASPAGGASNFPIPDWILVARNGSNPGNAENAATFTGVGAINNPAPANLNYATGRYAYTIYNEGGLLDANVAGYPSSIIPTSGYTPPAISGTVPGITDQGMFKSAAAYADLTQLQDFNGGQLLTQSQVDQLVGWRNNASSAAKGTQGSYTFPSALASVTGFYYWATLNPGRFLTANTGLGTSSGTLGNSDRQFISRQQLIQFVLSGMTPSSSTIPPTAKQQALLQCLGTFSRTLDQPSIWPDPTRNKVKLQPAQADGSGRYIDGGITAGGNSAYSADGSLTDVFNPVFRRVTAATNFSRADGTKAVVGEPLVKKRFALSRVAWLTYEGPSALAADQAVLVDEYVKRGMSQADAKHLLDEGTAENIKSYFGLKWYAGKGTNGLGGYWLYDNTIKTGGVSTLGSLYDPLSSSTPKDIASAGREPDFFELLKAAVNVGAIGKDWSGIGTTGYQGVQDSSVSPQIFAIGANIIEEANPTQFPTTIRYFYAQNDLREVYGKTDLPYCSGDCTFPVIIKPSTTAPTSTGAPTGPVATTISDYTDASGTGAILMCPRIWNPYDVNGPVVNSALAPTRLRIVVSDPIANYNYDADPTHWPPNNSVGWGLGTYPWQFQGRSAFKTSGAPAGWIAPPQLRTDTPTDTNLNPVPYIIQYVVSCNWTSEESTSLEFNNVPSLYREPTLLFRIPATSDLDAASGLTMGSGNVIINTAGCGAGGIPELGAVKSNQSFIGALIGRVPLRFTLPAVLPSPAPVPPPPTTYYIYSIDEIDMRVPAKAATWRLEYQLPGTNIWIPYQDKLVSGSQSSFSVTVKAQDGSLNAPFVLTPNDTSTTPSNPGSILYNNDRGSGHPSGYSPYAQMVHEDFWDPRTDRWSAPGDMGDSPYFLNPGATTSVAPVSGRMQSYRPTGAIGGGTHSGAATSTISGWHRDPNPNNGPSLGLISQNLFVNSSFYCYDADTITRRASGGLNQSVATPSSPAPTTIGLPLAAPTPAATNGSNRPVMLHRPYRSVAELGYVFSDTPWKNLDLGIAESGFNMLLDLFCIDEDTRTDGLVAGKVDLNTRQPSVVKAMINNAYREVLSPTPNVVITAAQAKLAAADSSTLSTALIKRTWGTAPQLGPLANISELVGRNVIAAYAGSGVNNSNVQPYSGFAEDLSAKGSTAPIDVIQRFRESPIRALSSQGQAGTWNLMIDLIAQTGRYPSSATTVQQFAVEGERRYWVHVAIDRQSGQVIDQQIEQVNE